MNGNTEICIEEGESNVYADLAPNSPLWAAVVAMAVAEPAHKRHLLDLRKLARARACQG